MHSILKMRAIHLAASAALLLGGLPAMAQELAANAPPLPLQVSGAVQMPDMDGGPMAPQRPPMERAFRMGPRGRWWDDPDITQKLGLSADQQKKMDDIFQQSRLKLIDEHASVEKEETILEPLLSSDQPDEARILAQIDKVAQARAELEKANARMLLGLRGVLTPVQWKTLQTMRPERREHVIIRRDDMRGPRALRGPDGPQGGDAPPAPPPGGAPGPQ